MSKLVLLLHLVAFVAVLPVSSAKYLNPKNPHPISKFEQDPSIEQATWKLAVLTTQLDNVLFPPITLPPDMTTYHSNHFRGLQKLSKYESFEIENGKTRSIYTFDKLEFRSTVRDVGGTEIWIRFKLSNLKYQVDFIHTESEIPIIVGLKQITLPHVEIDYRIDSLLSSSIETERKVANANSLAEQIKKNYLQQVISSVFSIGNFNRIFSVMKTHKHLIDLLLNGLHSKDVSLAEFDWEKFGREYYSIMYAKLWLLCERYELEENYQTYFNYTENYTTKKAIVNISGGKLYDLEYYRKEFSQPTENRFIFKFDEFYVQYNITVKYDDGKMYSGKLILYQSGHKTDETYELYCGFLGCWPNIVNRRIVSKGQVKYDFGSWDLYFLKSQLDTVVGEVQDRMLEKLARSGIDGEGPARYECPQQN